eukprot:6989960-Prymnesium_polylepis.1
MGSVGGEPQCTQRGCVVLKRRVLPSRSQLRAQWSLVRRCWTSPWGRRARARTPQHQRRRSHVRPFVTVQLEVPPQRLHGNLSSWNVPVSHTHISQERKVLDAAARCATTHEICRRASRRRRG